MMRMGAMSSRPITPEEPTASQQQQRQQQRQRQQRQHQLEEASEEGGKPSTPSSVPPPPSPEGQPPPGADAAGENPEGVEGTPSIRGHVEPSSFSSTSSSASLSRGGAAAAPRKEPTLGARPACNKPVLRDNRKGKGKVKAFAVARKSGGKVGGGGGAGAGGGGGGSGSGAKGAAAAKIGGGNKKSSGFGHGKRPRAGQSHKRARKDGTGDEAATTTVQPEKARVPPEMEKLWTNCAKHFLPIRNSDEAKLMGMEHALLDGWGVDPGAARKLAENYKGSWLHPEMGPKELVEGLGLLMPPELKRGPIVRLGRPYRDVWAEESFIESLEQRSRDWERPQQAAGAGAVGGAASAAATPTGAAAGGTGAGAAGITEVGERRSLRAVGRRTSGFGFAAGGGGSGGGSSGGGGSDGGGNSVVVPYFSPVGDWAKVVPSHDEARFRQSLAAARHRMGFAGREGFYAVDGWEEEEVVVVRGAAAAASKEKGVGEDGQRGGKERGGAAQSAREPKQGAGEPLSSRPPSLPPNRASREKPPPSSRQEPPPAAKSRLKLPGASSSSSSGGASASGSGGGVPSDQQQQQQQEPGEGGGVPLGGKGVYSNCHPVLPPRKLKRGPAQRVSEIVAASAAAAGVAAAAAAAGGGAGVAGASLPPKVAVPSAAMGGKGSGRNCSTGGGKKGRKGAGRGKAGRKGKEGGEEEGEEEGGEGEEDDDEVCRELRLAWEALRLADARSLFKTVELEGLCRQEKYVFQSVWDRAQDAKDILCSALLLSEAGKGAGRKDNKVRQQVGLGDDFPYHDPSEEPVIEARRLKTEAEQRSQWTNEEMAGCPLQEVEEEKGKRDKRKREATEIAEATEREWEPRRLSARREGQRGRGRGIPIPGGVAHPFLVNREGADFLYSISGGDEVEAKDEWGTWSRGKVVAVRGEGGWVPEKDTNVLRAVKVSFHGWGPAMDSWLPVDGGMLAKPGTHLPIHAKRARSRAQDASAAAAEAAAAATAAAAAMSPPTTTQARAHNLDNRQYHPEPAANAAAAAAYSNGDAPTPSSPASTPLGVSPSPSAAATATVSAATPFGGEQYAPGHPGVVHGGGQRRRSAASQENPAGVEEAVGEGEVVEVGDEDAGGGEGEAGEGEREGGGGVGELALGCRGKEGTLCWRGAGGGSGGGGGGGSASERQQRAVDGGFGTIASRLRFAHGSNGGPGAAVGSGQVGGGGCDGRSSGGSDGIGGSGGSGSADRPRFTRGRASVVVHSQQGRTTSHPREHGDTPSSRTLPLAGDSPTSNHSSGGGGSGGRVANGVASSASATSSQGERRGGRFGNGGGGGNRGGRGGGRGGGGSGLGGNPGSGVASDDRNNRYNRWANVGVVDWEARDGEDSKERRSPGGGGGDGGGGEGGGASRPGVLQWRGPTPTVGVATSFEVESNSSGPSTVMARASAVAAASAIAAAAAADAEYDDDDAFVERGAPSAVGTAPLSSAEAVNFAAIGARWPSPAAAAALAATATGGVAMEPSSVTPALRKRATHGAGLGDARFAGQAEHRLMAAVASTAGQFEDETGLDGGGHAASVGHSGAVGEEGQGDFQAGVAPASAAPSPYLGGKAGATAAAAAAPPTPATPVGSGYAANVRSSSSSRLKVVLRRS